MTNPEYIKLLKQGVNAWNEWRDKHSYVRPILNYQNLSRVDLRNAKLYDVSLYNAKLRHANLTGANLSGANLNGADLTNANLTGANLIHVDLSGAILSGADFTNTFIGSTTFVNNFLSHVQGLETVRHVYPSGVGIDTIYQSHGNIPEKFLRGCGVPKTSSAICAL